MINKEKIRNVSNEDSQSTSIDRPLEDINLPPLLEKALYDKNRKKYGLNILFADKNKKPLQKDWTKWIEKKQTDKDLIKMHKKAHTNYGYLTGFNGLIALDFDAEWIYYEALEKFEQRLHNTLTVKTPNGGYHAYYIVKHPENYVKYKKSLKVEILGKMNAIAYGKAQKANNETRNYTTLFNVPIIKDNQIFEDIKIFLSETLTKYDFLSYNCIKDKLSTKIHYLTHEQRLHLCNLFLQKKASASVTINFFKMCDDFNKEITKYQIEKTQEKIDSNKLSFPSCETLMKDFEWDIKKCYGCIRKQPSITGLQIEDDKVPNLTTRIVESVEKLVKLFTFNGVPYGEYNVNGHYETRPVRSNEFKGLLYELGKNLNEGEIPGSDVISNAKNYLEAVALRADEIKLNNRVASHEDSFWYDLSNKEWSAMKISKEGWKLVDHPPTLFRREQHQKAQVIPSVEGGNLWELFDYVNVPADKQLLLLIWIITTFIPNIPHPLIIIYGPPGAGKSILIEFMSEIIDPSLVPKLRIPRGDKDLLQNFDHHYAPFFDNLDTIQPWLSDMICRAVTGEGSEYRKLYSDDGAVIREFKRVVGLTGVNVPARKGDLLDRGILIGLIGLSEDKRVDETKLKEKFYHILPGILGDIFSIISDAMTIYPTVELGKLPRMADFAKWGYAIAEAIDGNGEAFLTAYSQDKKDRAIETLEANQLTSTMLSFMEDKKEWTGTPTKLLNELVTEAVENSNINYNPKTLPDNPTWLIRRLKEFETVLLIAGIEIEQHRNSQNRTITLCKIH